MAAHEELHGRARHCNEVRALAAGADVPDVPDVPNVRKRQGRELGRDAGERLVVAEAPARDDHLAGRVAPAGAALGQRGHGLEAARLGEGVLAAPGVRLGLEQPQRAEHLARRAERRATLGPGEHGREIVGGPRLLRRAPVERRRARARGRARSARRA